MPKRIGTWIVHDGRDLFQGKPEFPVEQDLLQPLQIRLLVDAVSSRAASVGREQPDLIVVVQRPDRHTSEGRHFTNRVAHGSPPLHAKSKASRHVRVKGVFSKFSERATIFDLEYLENHLWQRSVPS